MNLDDIRVLQPGDRLGFALKACPFLWGGVGAGQQHLQGDHAIEAQVPRAVDDPHPSAAEDCVHFVARYLRQVCLLRLRHRAVGRRKEGVEVGAEAADSAPLSADHGQQLRARLADLLGGRGRGEQLVDHCWTRGSSVMAQLPPRVASRLGQDRRRPGTGRPAPQPAIAGPGSDAG